MSLSIKKFLLPCLLVIVLFHTNITAQDEKFGIQFNAGVNYTDMNFGYDYVKEVLAWDDYLYKSLGGSAGRGFYGGLSLEYPIADKWTIIGGGNYSIHRTLVEGDVRNLKPSANRPPSSSIYTDADGRVDFQLLELKAGISYHFNQDLKKGVFGSLLFSHLIHMGQNMDLDVVSETGSNVLYGHSGDVYPDEYPLNNFSILSLETGYLFPITNKTSLAPKIGFGLGLNPVNDRTNKPMTMRAGLQFCTWF